MPLSLAILIIVASIVRFGLAMLFPITADESYYWLWSKHLSLSYVDHPPMVALINFLTTMGKENLIGLRLGVVIIAAITTLLIYFIAKKLFNEKIAFWSAVLFQIVPHFLIIWLTMFVELPLVMFWTASLLVLAIIIKDKKPAFWYLLAIITGLGYLSKYTMFLFWPCLLLFFILSPEDRFWLQKKELYLAFLLSLIFFIPVLIWNAQHSWVSFTFHGAKVSGEPWGRHVIPFIGDQLVHFTPFLIFPLYGITRFALRKTESKLLLAFSLPVILLFLVLSLKIKVWAHWPSAGYIGLIPLSLAYLIETNKSWQKFIGWISLFSMLVLAILFWGSPGVLLHQSEYASNYQLSSRLPGNIKLFSQTNVSASLLEFYLKRPVYMATGFLKVGAPWGQKEYEIWGIPGLQKGESILYYGDGNDAFKNQALDHFQRLIELPQPRLYLVEDYITANYRFYRLEDFKGGALHP